MIIENFHYGYFCIQMDMASKLRYFILKGSLTRGYSSTFEPSIKNNNGRHFISQPFSLPVRFLETRRQHLPVGYYRSEPFIHHFDLHSWQFLPELS